MLKNIKTKKNKNKMPYGYNKEITICFMQSTETIERLIHKDLIIHERKPYDNGIIKNKLYRTACLAYMANKAAKANHDNILDLTKDVTENTRAMIDLTNEADYRSKAKISLDDLYQSLKIIIASPMTIDLEKTFIEARGHIKSVDMYSRILFTIINLYLLHIRYCLCILDYEEMLKEEKQSQIDAVTLMKLKNLIIRQVYIVLVKIKGYKDNLGKLLYPETTKIIRGKINELIKRVGNSNRGLLNIEKEFNEIIDKAELKGDKKIKYKN